METLGGLSATVGTAMLSALWQGALLAAVAALGLRMAARLSAATRARVWLSVFFLVTALPFLSFVFHSKGVGVGVGVGVGRGAAWRLDAGWALALLGLWALLTAVRLAAIAGGLWRLRSLLRRAVEMEPTAAVAALLEWRSGRRARLCVSEEVARPCVAGFRRPCVLMPPALLARLGEEELALVLEHECEHLRRRDGWSNLAQKLFLALFPLNPALLWVERRICQERELACDDRVLRAGVPRAYALCLARLAEFSLTRRGLALALGAWERRPELTRRVERILARPAQAMQGASARLAAGAVLGAAALCALALAHVPAFVGFAPAAAPRLLASSTAPALVVGLQTAESSRPARALVRTPRPQRRLSAAPPPAPAMELAALELPEAVALDAPEAEAQAVQARPVAMVWSEEAERGEGRRAGSGQPPPQLIQAVERLPRARYAALAVPGGWLIVQI